MHCSVTHTAAPIMQESRVVRVIRKQLVKRSLDMLKEIASRPADDKGKSDYDTFYEAFGRCVP
jgi:heat shock protein 90kDa beta